MIRLNCDYSEGAHPKILEKLMKLILNKLMDMEWIHIVKKQ